MMQNRPSTDSKKSGFALIAVIWLSGMIAALAVGFAVKVKLDLAMTRNVLQSTEAEYIADGLVRLTAWRLARDADIKSDGASITCKYRNDVSVRIAVQDQSGLIDLNSMPTSFFVAFFKRMGAADADAEKLAGDMEDFRDFDDQAKDGSQEPALYPNRSFGPKNAPFQAIEEINQVPGMTEELYRASLPYFTVFSSQAGIAPDAAPLFLRATFNEAGKNKFRGALQDFNIPALRKAFSITVEVQLADGASFQRRAISVSLQQPDKPFVFLEWQQGFGGTVEKSSAIKSCI